MKKVEKKKRNGGIKAKIEGAVVNLGNVADVYGELAEQKKKIEEQLKNLREQVIESGQKEIIGKKYKLTITVDERPEMSVGAVYDRLDIETFLRIANVSVSKLRAVMNPTDFEECVIKYHYVKKVIPKKL